MSKVIKGVNDFESWCKQNNHEDLLSEWDFTKNIGITPDAIAIGSNKHIWWIGKCGHSWDIRLNTRIKLNTKCPYCSGKRVLSGFNDIQTTHPTIASEWHPTKNGDLKPTDVSIGSNKKVWWLGKCGHEWEAYIYPRKKGVGCPKCKLALHTSFSEQAIYYYVKQYYPDAINGDKSAIGMELDIYIPSKKIAIEYDGAAYHSYDRATDIKKNQSCSEHGIQLIRVQENSKYLYDNCICIVRDKSRSKDDLTTIIKQIFALLGDITADIDVVRDEMAILGLYLNIKHNKSLSVVHPELVKEWHPTKNGNLTPDNVISGSMATVWWQGTCGHEWAARVAHRSAGSGCPYCNKGGSAYIMPGVNDLQTLFPKLAEEWDCQQNAGLKNGFGVDISAPDKINAKSSIKVGWVCPLGHHYTCSVSKRTIRGSGCPYCANRRLLPGFNDLASKYPKIANTWHPIKNMDLTPDSVLYGSGTKVWWKCNCGYEWKSRIVDRITYQKCPNCRLIV
jgi:hypothetical protein